MKQRINFSVIIFSLLLIVIVACRKSIIDGTTWIPGEPLLNVLTIQVLDANPDVLLAISDNAKVSVVGKDADKVYSLEGSKTLNVENGFISVGLLRRDTALSGKTLEFMLIVQAEGYLDGRQNYVLTSVNAPTNEVLRMVRIANPAKGVAVQTETITLGANNQTTAPITMNITVPGRAEDAKITVPAGTRMLDKDGNTVTGTVQATVVHFDATNPTSLNSFPGGLTYNSSRDSSGSSRGGGSFTTFGFTAITMSAGGKEVKSFSQPMEVSMDLNQNIERADSAGNPTALAIGQRIPVWSLNETSGEWQAEGLATVERDPASGKLKANFKQSHLSWWNLDDPSCAYQTWWLSYGKWLGFPYDARGCESCGTAGLQIQSNFNTGNPNGGSRFYIEVYNAFSPWQVYKSYHDDLVNGSTLYLNNYLGGLQRGLRLFFKIYDRQGGTQLYPLAGQLPTIYQPCADAAAGRKLNFSSVVLPPTKVTVRVDFSGTCAATGGATAALFPNNASVLYKDASRPNDPWTLFGIMRNGVVESDVLRRGKSYIFGVFHGRLNFTTSVMGQLVAGAPIGSISIPATRDGQNINISLDNTPTHWTLRGKGNLILRALPNTDNYILVPASNPNATNARNYPLPTYLCDKYKQYF